MWLVRGHLDPTGVLPMAALLWLLCSSEVADSNPGSAVGGKMLALAGNRTCFVQ